jgi:hypothetical protein
MLPLAALVELIAALPLAGPAYGTCTGDGHELYAERAFFGYACRDDCAPQKAGFSWAERHGITDPAVCAVLASAVAEGCRAFVHEGLAPEEAGYAWALENEVAQPCLCVGAGDGFRAGCRRYVKAR